MPALYPHSNMAQNYVRPTSLYTRFCSYNLIVWKYTFCQWSRFAKSANLIWRLWLFFLCYWIMFFSPKIYWNYLHTREQSPSVCVCVCAGVCVGVFVCVCVCMCVREIEGVYICFMCVCSSFCPFFFILFCQSVFKLRRHFLTISQCMYMKIFVLCLLFSEKSPCDSALLLPIQSPIV